MRAMAGVDLDSGAPRRIDAAPVSARQAEANGAWGRVPMHALVLGLALLVFGALAGTAGAEPIRIRFSHVVAEDTPKGIGASLFKKRVEERLAGKVTVTVYPNSKLYDDGRVLQAMLFGDVEMAAPSLSKFENFTKAFQVFDLPFLFEDIEAVHGFQDGAAGRKLLGSMTGWGLAGLAYWDNGMKVISANKPLRRPADAKGLKFRIQPSEVIEEQFRRLGAVSLKMPFAKVFDALKSGLVDGQENTWSNIYSKRFYKVQSHFTDTRHGFLGYVVVTGTKFWNGLPGDIRAELRDILAEVTAEVNKIAGEKAETDRQKVIDSGMTEVLTLTEDELAAWRGAMKPVWDKFEDQIGKDLIAAAVASNQ
jgi:C4-dicarboxylate-binding protein DctP